MSMDRVVKQCKVCEGRFDHFRLQTGYCKPCRKALPIPYNSNLGWVRSYLPNLLILYFLSWVVMPITAAIYLQRAYKVWDFWYLSLFASVISLIVAWVLRFYIIRNPFSGVIWSTLGVLGHLLLLVGMTGHASEVISAFTGNSGGFTLRGYAYAVTMYIAVIPLTLPYWILSTPDMLEYEKEIKADRERVAKVVAEYHNKPAGVVRNSPKPTKRKTAKKVDSGEFSLDKDLRKEVEHWHETEANIRQEAIDTWSKQPSS